MNIFRLHEDPRQAAQMHCDKHVVKMIVETAQLLSTAHHVCDPHTDHSLLYKKTHINHPCAVWVRHTSGNYFWTVDLLYHLLNEYATRYGRKHATGRLLQYLTRAPRKISYSAMTTQPICVSEDVEIRGDVVGSYRRYYNEVKAPMCQWKMGNAPTWFSASIFNREF